MLRKRGLDALELTFYENRLRRTRRGGEAMPTLIEATWDGWFEEHDARVSTQGMTQGRERDLAKAVRGCRATGCSNARLATNSWSASTACERLPASESRPAHTYTSKEYHCEHAWTDATAEPAAPFTPATCGRRWSPLGQRLGRNSFAACTRLAAVRRVRYDAWWTP